jgi:hypothetical protein
MKYCRYCCKQYKTISDVCPTCGRYLMPNVGWHTGLIYCLMSAIIVIWLFIWFVC